MMLEPIELSFVIPCHNEEGHLPALIEAITKAMETQGLSYEIIIHDDASTDNSWAVLKKLATQDAHLRVRRFKNNAGESAASWAGMQIAQGRYIVTLDADLQNDLCDLPAFLEALRSYDCVCGSRVLSRRDGDSIGCRLSSRLANWVRNKLLNDGISDSGCTYRAFRRECLSRVRFFKGAHRFLPALFRMEGFSVTEIPVRNNPRSYGKSHYGAINRGIVSLIDLCAVKWMKSRTIQYEVIDQECNETKV